MGKPDYEIYKSQAFCFCREVDIPIQDEEPQKVKVALEVKDFQTITPVRKEKTNVVQIPEIQDYRRITPVASQRSNRRPIESIRSSDEEDYGQAY